VNAPSPRPVPIASATEAELAISNLNKIMDQLETTVAEETARVRAGKLSKARELDGAKSELARLYMSQSEQVKAASAVITRLLPQELNALRDRHAAFQSLLQTNLTVLATAHAVSEGIIRGVSNELARKSAPTVYGASGRTNVPNTHNAQPLTLSRSL
jgi:hypothetical protein